MALRRIATLIGVAACGIAVSACGSGEHATYADNEGPGYVQVANLNYQVQVSRELNQYDTSEDAWYLKGFSAAQLKLPIADEWFGISLQVYNWSNRAGTPSPTGDFYITDTLGDRFVPLANPDPNAYTYAPVSIPPGGQLPAIGSDAYSTWSDGEFLIFKIPYSDLPNRPFVLHIVNPHDAANRAQIELDV